VSRREVDVKPLRRFNRRAPRRTGRIDRRDLSTRAVAADQETLGNQLAVRVDDEPAGHSEVRREHPRRGQSGLRREPAGADGVAQAVG
jgi:hypothetical protein